VLSATAVRLRWLAPIRDTLIVVAITAADTREGRQNLA